MKADLAVAQVREFWRILEAAFREKGDRLVNRLRQYEPARKLGFDKSEINQLLKLRDRASHAYSRSGLKEIVYVEQECTKQLPPSQEPM